MRILLISMPFGAVDRPALGLSLLKSNLQINGVRCDIRYLFAEFIDQIGLDNYQWLTDQVPYTSFAGDWCFTLPLYGRRAEIDWEYVETVLRKTWQMPAHDIARIVDIREQTADYINHCVNLIAWHKYDVVGFTSTFVQNLSSLALAKELKQKYPALKIVFGGANWQEQMGETLFQLFPFVDYVCQGEADISFPTLIEMLNNDENRSIPGVLIRSEDERYADKITPEPVKDLDALPIPEYAEYFSMLEKKGFLKTVQPTLLMEASRGCWWGQKSHCTFCGLNGQDMAFRAKSAERALVELNYLVRKWAPSLVSFVDNILHMGYFKEFIPKLGEAPLKTRLFFEVKANLTRDQVGALSRAGILDIQPGIESLSNHVLRLMKKGTTVLQNIQLLKWCKEFGINVEWNILYDFPGETLEDYDRTLQYMQLIRHLQPPSGSGPIRLDRFSPYFQAPLEHGLTKLRILPVYRYLYLGSDALLAQLACYFEFSYLPGFKPDNAAADVVAYLDNWRQDTNPGALTFTDLGDQLRIDDSRSNTPSQQYLLAHYDRAVYLICDKVSSVRRVQRHLGTLYPGEKFSTESIVSLLDALCEMGLMAKDENRYLAIGISAQPEFDYAEYRATSARQALTHQ